MLATLSLVRLAFSPAFELVPQEAYYFFYSRHLALSYFDHPPAIAYLIRLFTEVLGVHALSIRATALTLTLLTQWSWLRLAQRFVQSPERWSAGVILFCSTGMVTVLSLVSTPDVPLILFWTLTLLALQRALFQGHAASWILAGVWMGLSFDSKYTGLFLQLGLLLFLLLSPRYRILLKTWKPYVCLAVTHAMAAPVYLWNYQHHLASLLYQSVDRVPQGEFHLRYLAGLVGTQFVLLGPLLIIGMVGVAYRLLRRGHSEAGSKALPQGASGSPGASENLFLLCFFLPAFLLFVGWSVFALVKPNWLMPCYVTGTLLAVRVLSRRQIYLNLAFSALLHVAAAIQLVFYPIPIRSDDTWVGWKELATRVRALSQEYPQAFIFSADGYKTTSELLFYFGTKVYGPNVVGQRGLQFDYVDTDLSPLQGRDALFIHSTPNDFSPGRSGRIPEILLNRFRQTKELDPILILKDRRVVRKFLVYACQSYRGPSSAIGQSLLPRYIGNYRSSSFISLARGNTISDPGHRSRHAGSK